MLKQQTSQLQMNKICHGTNTVSQAHNTTRIPIKAI